MGELKATERGTGPEERTLPRGRVVASLVDRERLPGSKGPGDPHGGHRPSRPLAPSQSVSGRARDHPVHPAAADAGYRGSHRLLPWLPRRPRGATADGAVGPIRGRDALGTEFRVELSGRLERVPPGELKLADLEVLNPGLEPFLRDEVQGFTRAGGEGIRRVERQLRQRVPPPEGSPPQTRCERVTHYSAERFVDLADLSRVGVRDPRILGTEICCLDHDSHGESEECSAEKAE